MQICIRWGLQHGSSVIPKGTSKDHVLGNLDVLDWELKSEDYEVILALSLWKFDGATCMSECACVCACLRTFAWSSNKLSITC